MTNAARGTAAPRFSIDGRSTPRHDSRCVRATLACGDRDLVMPVLPPVLPRLFRNRPTGGGNVSAHSFHRIAGSQRRRRQRGNAKDDFLEHESVLGSPRKRRAPLPAVTTSSSPGEGETAIAGHPIILSAASLATRRTSTNPYWQAVPGATSTSRVICFVTPKPLIVSASVPRLPSAKATLALPTGIAVTCDASNGMAANEGPVVR